MRLTAQVLNSDASLNSWKVIGTQDFYPGEDITLKIRLFDQAENLRYVPPATTTMTIVFQTVTGELSKSVTLDASDRSLGTVAITSTESADLVGGNAYFTLDEAGDGSVIRKGVVRNILSKVVADS